MNVAIEATPAIRQVAPSFAAEIVGLTISGDMPDAALAQFRDALHRYRVVIVPGQSLAPADLVAFSRRLGPLEIHASFDNTLPDHREVFCVGNVERDGMKASFARGVEQWHGDSSYRAVPSDASLFYGEIVPPEGGETMFADATAAYDTLDPATQERIEGLQAVHSLQTLKAWQQRHNPERAPLSEAKKAAWPAATHPLVRRHPVTGKKSLYLCPAVISHVEGLDEAEGRALVDALMAHTAQPGFVYSHRWRRGDLVMWDNRAVLHTASLFDHTRYERLLFRTTVAGGGLSG